VEPAAHRMTFAERERLFDQVDAFLAGRPRVRPDEEAHETYNCPDCGNPTLLRHYRYGTGGTTYCPNCGWEAVPSERQQP
jgi:predicted RNA-binding Zn-ribbon protein involved in translation (DUF1610 family)